MSRILITAVVLGSLTAGALAAPPAPQVFTGRIKDIRGTDGTLTLTLGEGKEAMDRNFLIMEARIVGQGGAEWKVDDLHRGDLVEVEMARGGKLVKEIRFVSDGQNRR
jgi:hypothetical protein